MFNSSKLSFHIMMYFFFKPQELNKTSIWSCISRWKTIIPDTMVVFLFFVFKKKT